MSPTRRPGPAKKPRLLHVATRPGAAPHLGLVRVAGLTLPCALGRSGLTRFKREGDGATPVGRFELLGGYRRADRALPPGGPLTLTPIRPDDGWCDDVGDGRYNRLVRLPLTASHETMRRDDSLYDIVVVLDANFRRRSIGRGSAIFLHIARDGFEPTAGCVALRPADMRRLLPRLGTRPVLIIGRR
jgi:L,D-peptidoglycan transpeptidase YkuD (ErfK/YbiS/YcfS/YnhG family)